MSTMVHEDREYDACKLPATLVEVLGRPTCASNKVVRAESGETMGVCVEQLEFTAKEGAQEWIG